MGDNNSTNKMDADTQEKVDRTLADSGVDQADLSDPAKEKAKLADDMEDDSSR